MDYSLKVRNNTDKPTFIIKNIINSRNNKAFIIKTLNKTWLTRNNSEKT